MEKIESQKQKSIFFTFTFEEEIDRVYYSFTNPSIFNEIFLCKLCTSKNFRDVIYLDEPNKEFSNTILNDYDLVYKINKDIISISSIKQYSHETTSIFNKKVNKISDFKIIFTYTFIWNSAEHNTLFINEIKTEPEDRLNKISLIYSNYNLTHGCENLKVYLTSSTFHLDQLESVLIESSFMKVFQTLSSSKTFLPTILLCDSTENNSISIQGGFNSLGTIFTIYDKNNPNRIIMKLSLKNFQITAEKIKFLLESKKIDNTPIQNIQVLIESLNQENCLLLVKHIFLEYIPCKSICDLGKKKRTTLKILKTKLCDL